MSSISDSHAQLTQPLCQAHSVNSSLVSDIPRNPHVKIESDL